MLVGLDWAEPMMFLMLHVICSCIFYAYIPNFVSIILILNCLVLFCMSLSLSPFFSLALVCSMTPKHKSTPSWNPLHSRASSSSSSPSNCTPSHFQFHDDKAHKEFLKNFSRRGIHSERQIVLSNFSNTDLPTVIYSRVRSHCVASRSLVPP